MEGQNNKRQNNFWNTFVQHTMIVEMRNIYMRLRSNVSWELHNCALFSIVKTMKYKFLEWPIISYWSAIQYLLTI